MTAVVEKDPVRADRAPHFWARVDVRGANACWPWRGATDPNGYGVFWTGSLTTSAHRVAYELVHGPTSLNVDHTCHNADPDCPRGNACTHRGCCNPAHLEAVTHDENVRRAHDRPTCGRGHVYAEVGFYRYHGHQRRCRACERIYRQRQKAMSR